MIKREIEDKILTRLDSDEVLILKGPRQIGKTTILKKFIRDVSSKANAYYITLENQLNLEYLNESPENLFKIIPSENGKKQYVFIDEIQYLKDPSKVLKSLNENYKDKIKLIVSMDSSFYENGNNSDSLMGQKRIYEVGPITFHEYIAYRNSDIAKFLASGASSEPGRQVPAIYRSEVDQYFYEYIKYGGYPNVVVEKDPQEKQNILEELVNSYINHEVRKTGIRDTLKFYRLLKLLAERVGELLNVSELAHTLALSSPTVEGYIRLLQSNMKIKTIRPYTCGHAKELCKMSKFYFCDLGIRNAVLNNFDNLPDRWDRERYFENIVFNFLNAREDVKSIQFWRTQTKHEVDFIINERTAFDIRFNGHVVNTKKFKKFKELYPDMNLDFVTFSQDTAGSLHMLNV